MNDFVAGITRTLGKKLLPWRSSPEQCICRNPRLSTRTLAANILSYMRSAPGVQKMHPIDHWIPPSAQGKAHWHVGGLRATYAHAAAHMRCTLAYHMHDNCSRSSGCALYWRIRRAPASAAYERRLHQNLSAGTCAPGRYNAMWNGLPAYAACSVLRSAPGASSPEIVGVWPFTVAVRTPQRPRLADEARPAASRCARRCARALDPVRVASATLWARARNVCLLSAARAL